MVAMHRLNQTVRFSWVDPAWLATPLMPIVAAFVFASCGAAERTSGDVDPAVVHLKVRNGLYHEGHQMYLTGNFDSAQVLLGRAAGMDSSFIDPLAELGMLHYDLAMAEKSDQSKTRASHLREAREYLARVEVLGTSDEAVYERLCEITVALNDDHAFLKYARKSAERFPFERQYYNLGLAYFGVGDFQNVVISQKEAIVKFGQTQYLGGYYRQLGRAYMKLDRDQTAQRTFEAGLTVLDARLHGLARDHGTGTAATKRLSDDRVAILRLLQRLYLTYHVDDKLKSVEQLLSEAGEQR